MNRVMGSFLLRTSGLEVIPVTNSDLSDGDSS
jgi:hypothetical protein